MRINFRFDVWPERRERVERFGPRPLALGVLNRAVANVLRRRVTEDVTRRGGGPIYFWLHGSAGHQRPHDPGCGEPMGARQVVRHFHAPGALCGDEDRSA